MRAKMVLTFIPACGTMTVGRCNNLVIEFSKKAHGDLNLTSNFKVSEFACKDGSDKLLIDTRIVDALQKIRNHFKAPVIITSAYRTKTYDKKVGGTGSGYHTKGMAVDIKISGVSPVAIGVYALELFGEHGGVEIGDSYCHLDTRDTRWRAFTKTGGSNYKTVNDLGSHLTVK